MNQGESLDINANNREKQQQSYNLATNTSLPPKNSAFEENRHRGAVTNKHPFNPFLKGKIAKAS